MDGCPLNPTDDSNLDNETSNGSCLGMFEFTAFQLENFPVL